MEALPAVAAVAAVQAPQPLADLTLRTPGPGEPEEPAASLSPPFATPNPMPLIPPSIAVSAELAQLVVKAATHVNIAADRLNEMSSALLGLDNERLTAWLNSYPPAELQQQFAQHLEAGEAVNGLLALFAAQLEASGTGFPRHPVDVRDFGTKLADRGRTLTAGPEGLVVADLPLPEPVNPPGEEVIP